MKWIVSLVIALVMFFCAAVGIAETWIIPEGITTNDSKLTAEAEAYERVVLPASFETYDSFEPFDVITAFEVVADNPYFCAVDGVVFSKDMTTLVAYPFAREVLEYQVPEGVIALGQGSIQ